MRKAFDRKAETPATATDCNDRLRPPRLAWTPLPIFFAAILWLWLWLNNIQTPSESPELIVTLNLILITAPFLGIAYLFFRSFLRTGAPGVALFGCGALFWSASGLAVLAPHLAPAADAANIIVTIHNLSIWTASLNTLAGAALLQRGWPATKQRRLALAAAFGSALAMAALIVIAPLQGWTPVFFVQGEGAALERQFVLGSTIFAIALTLSLLRQGIRLRSPFLDWFSLALMLLAIGYAGLILQTTVGGAVAWAGHASLYCGGFYMLIAARAAFCDATPPFVVFAQSRNRAPHPYSIAVALVLITAVVRLAFLPALETRVAFVTFYPAVMLAALYGGFRAGALATVLSAALADYLWIEPARSFATSSPMDRLSILIFVGNCLFVSWIVDLLQKAQARVRRLEAGRRAELGRMVAERTAELERANEAKTRLLEASTASEAELQAIFNAAPAGIWVARDRSCRTMQANRVATDWMRIPESANVSKTEPSLLRFDIFDKDGLPVPSSELPIRRAGCGEEVTGYEFEWRCPDSESRFFYGNATPLRDAHGTVTGSVAAFIDITERKKAEAALVENNKRLAAVLETQREIAGANLYYAGLLNAILERMSRLLSADGASLEIVDGDDLVYEAATGLAAGFVGLRVKIGASLSGLSMTGNKIMRSDDIESDPRVDRKACRRIGLHSMILMPLRYDERSFGVLKLMSAHEGAFTAGAEQTLRLMQEFLGVTIARQRAQAALQKSEERLRFIADRAQVGHWHWTVGADQLEWSPICKQLLCFPQGAPETYAQFLEALHPDDCERVDRAVRVCLEGGRDYDIEYRTRRPDGTVRWIHAKGDAVFTDGKPVRMAGIVIDISERKAAEAALLESEARYRHLADAMPQLVWTASSEGVVDYYNARAAEYAIADSPAIEWRPMVHPDDLAPTLEAWGEAVAAGRTYQKEHRLLVADGLYRWHLSRGVPQRDEKGVIVKWFGTTTDIDDFKRAEKALRESEERERQRRHELETTLAVIPAAVLIAEDRACARIIANQAGYDLMRIQEGKNVSKSARNDERPAYETYSATGELLAADELPMQRAAATGKSIGFEHELRFGDGGHRHVFGAAAPLFDAAGEVRGAVAALLDITGRRHAEEALRGSEGRFRGIFQNAGTAIGITDLQGRMCSCNPAFTVLLGYAEEELLGRNFKDFVHPEDLKENVQAVERLHTGTFPSFELFNRFIKKDGSAVWVHKRVSLLRDAAGNPTHHIALVTDMTERKQFEEHINLLLKEVNHRAKNMLAVVQAIARQTKAPSAEEFVERFGERIRALSANQDLLVKSEWRGVDMKELIRSQLAHFSGLIDARIDLSGPTLTISASAAQTLGMALHELATNAGKYGALSNEGGRLDVAWSLERGADGEERFGMSWRESGGPPVTKPERKGFGSTVISSLTRMSLDADVDLDFAPTGLSWRLECPSAKVLETGVFRVPPVRHCDGDEAKPEAIKGH